MSELSSVFVGDREPCSSCGKEGVGKSQCELVACPFRVKADTQEDVWRASRLADDTGEVTNRETTFYTDSYDDAVVARMALNAYERRLARAEQALRLITTDVSPPLPNGTVLVQHKLNGFEAGLHAKGTPCATCAALEEAGGHDEGPA